MNALVARKNISDYGLSFFFEIAKDLVLSKEFILVLYQVIVKIVRTKPEEVLPVPEMPGPDEEGNEPTEEVKSTVSKQIEAITVKNQEIERNNEQLAKI